MSSKLPYRHIGYAADRAVEYIEGRRSGRIKSLQVSHQKLNNITLNGFEWNRIVTLAGLSGSGKSMIVEQWKRDMIDLNPKEDFLILSFEFEMLATDQIARNLSGKMDISTRKLFGAEGKLTDAEMLEIKEHTQEMKRYPIYYVDKAGTVEDIRETIHDFIEQFDLNNKNTGLVITIDHILLTHGKQGEAERTVLQDLLRMCIEIKKEFDYNDKKVLFILLSQLNREIEDKERIMTPKLHFPQRSDIFGASAVFFASDYVIVTHNPSTLGLTAYGVHDKYPQGLPVKNPKDPTKNMIYWHVLKNRGGEPTVLMMTEDFRHSKVLDY